MRLKEMFLGFLLLAICAQGIRFDPSGQPLSDLRPVLVEPFFYQQTPRTHISTYSVTNKLVPRTYQSVYSVHRPLRQNTFFPSNGGRYASYASEFNPIKNALTVYAKNGECSPRYIALSPHTRLEIHFVNDDPVKRKFSIPGMGIETPPIFPQDSHTIFLQSPAFERTYQINCS